MGRHTPLEPGVGRHTLPIPVVETPPPTRPRVRDGQYRGALQLLNTLLAANIAVLLAFFGLIVFVVVALGPDRLPGFLIVALAIYCWRRRK
jgi:hypothetical protein